MNTGSIPMQRMPDKPFERLVVLEPISEHSDDNAELYEDELKAIFAFDHRSDPDRSEWLPPEEFSAFTPYLQTLRKARLASLLAAEALGRRRVLARDMVGRDRANKEHANASRERDAANARLRRLDRDGFGEMRLRAADRLRIRREGLELPTDLTLV